MKLIKRTGACVVVATAFAPSLAATAAHAESPRPTLPGVKGALLAREAKVLTDHGDSPARASEAIDVQGKMATTGIVRSLKTATGNAYGGVWFEPATARLHVGVTSPASRRSAKRTVQQAGLGAYVVLTQVRSTWSQLETAQAAWNRRLDALFARGEAETGLDAKRSAVTVTLSSSVPSTERTLIERVAARSHVKVFAAVVPHGLRLPGQAETKCKKLKVDEAACTKPLTSGVTVKATGLCTAGPMAIPTHNKLQTFLLTAGHCIKLFGGEGASWSAYTTTGELLEIGKAGKPTFSAEGDYGAIAINTPGNWTEKTGPPVFALTARWGVKTEKSFPIVGEQEPVKGDTVCLIGQSTGESCGLINEPVTFTVTDGTQEAKVVGLIEVEGATTEVGDSGGPWIFINKAEEVFVEGTHITKARFMPIKKTLEGLKMELLTTANEVRPLNPRVAPAPTEAAPLKFTSETDKTATKLETTGKNLIECQKESQTGEFTTERSGVVSTTLSECKSSGLSCNTGGDAAGTILLAKSTLHLVDVLLPKEVLGLGFAIKLPETVKISCSIITVPLTGTSLGEISSVKQEEPTKHVELLFAQKATGEQEYSMCDLDAAFCEKEGKPIQFKLELDFGKGFSLAAAQSTLLVSLEKEAEFYF